MILGHGGLHEPGAGAGPAARQADGHLGVRLRAVRNADGRTPFAGDTISDTLAGDPRTRAGLGRAARHRPTRLRLLLRRCLEKDWRRQRIADISVAQFVLDDLADVKRQPTAPGGSAAIASTTTAVAPPATSSGRPGRRRGDRTVAAVRVVVRATGRSACQRFLLSPPARVVDIRRLRDTAWPSRRTEGGSSTSAPMTRRLNLDTLDRPIESTPFTGRRSKTFGPSLAGRPVGGVPRRQQAAEEGPRGRWLGAHGL